jgi:uncharacterized protein involved in type VI secretion and phage assembly
MPGSYFGKYSGIVSDNADAHKLGELKVEVPAVFGDAEAVVARAALPYGVFFMPDVGVNVWIEFEGGDTGLPLWTGVQYVAGSEWAKESDMPEKRVIRTPSGHFVLFDDKSGEEKIEIVEAKAKVKITIDSSASTLKIECDKDVTIESPNGKLTLKGKGVEIESTDAMSVKASGDMTLKGSKVAIN